MSVYVDKITRCAPTTGWPFPAHSHLWADTLEELHAFAARLGLFYRWFHNKPGGLPHYDLATTIRRKALDMGAIEADHQTLTAAIRAAAGEAREATP